MGRVGTDSVGESKGTSSVESVSPGADEGLGVEDANEVRAAADGVDAERVVDELSPDQFELAAAGPRPEGIPLSMMTATDSPIDSAKVVETMGELDALGTGAAASFDPADYPGVVSPDPSAPFTGSGATGISPVDGAIPALDLAAMARYKTAERDAELSRSKIEEMEALRASERPDLTDWERDRQNEILDQDLENERVNLEMSEAILTELGPTVDRYRNPLSEGPGIPSADLRWDEGMRERQAELLLEQPISTLHAEAYGDTLPTRAEVIEAAAERYNLDPSVVAGFILHEQRDQSLREDAADFGGATLGGGDQSIGLGQILMSTAMKNGADLLADTVDPETRATLDRSAVARLLASDEHNIFATARYLRSVADAAPGAGPLPVTSSVYPGFDPNGYSGSSWSDPNIGAIASEYTSRPWDDRVLPAWGYPRDVITAVHDVRRTGLF